MKNFNSNAEKIHFNQHLDILKSQQKSCLDLIEKTNNQVELISNKLQTCQNKIKEYYLEELQTVKSNLLYAEGTLGQIKEEIKNTQQTLADLENAIEQSKSGCLTM